MMEYLGKHITSGLRNIWGSEATIHVIKPGAITAA